MNIILAFIIPILIFLAWNFLVSTSRVSTAQWSSKNVLLLTAHPDDECMFFSPTILNLIPIAKVQVLCMSEGNDEGVRQKELESSCKVLGISKCESVNHELLQDGMSTNWDLDTIIGLTKAYVEKEGIDSIMTFDGYGVSGHVNHIALFRAMEQAVKSKTLTIPVFKLKSISVFTKFTFFIGAGFRYFFTSRGRSHFFAASPTQYMVGRAAMYTHKSQMVWFRHLYLVFSQYMILNELTLVRPTLR